MFADERYSGLRVASRAFTGVNGQALAVAVSANWAGSER